MNNFKHINIDHFNYILPDEKIAKFPISQRDHSNLLIYNKGNITQNKFYNLINYLPENSQLIFNNTNVIQARLIFTKPTGANIEIFCLEPHYPNDYSSIFIQKKRCQWKCIIGNSKKWKEGSIEKVIQTANESIILSAKKISVDTNNVIIEFSWKNEHLSFGELLESGGIIPIPPYLKRDSHDLDKERYQTVYSKFDGSVAAPTAGLHFTETILQQLEAHRIDIAEITLHVGAGTFKPVKSNSIGEHLMHTEHYIVNIDIINKLLSDKYTIATGTTTLRTLESIYWAGVKCKMGLSPLQIEQWDPYTLNNSFSKTDSLNALKNYLIKNGQDQFYASTQLMIVPGYKFKIVKGLITNYHQPRSTLLLLVSAFIGADWKKIYEYALKNNFRFLSYGDSSLLLP